MPKESSVDNFSSTSQLRPKKKTFPPNLAASESSPFIVWTWKIFERFFEVPVHSSKGKMKKSSGGRGSGKPLKRGVLAIFRGLPDLPLGNF